MNYAQVKKISSNNPNTGMLKITTDSQNICYQEIKEEEKERNQKINFFINIIFGIFLPVAFSKHIVIFLLLISCLVLSLTISFIKCTKNIKKRKSDQIKIIENLKELGMIFPKKKESMFKKIMKFF